MTNKFGRQLVASLLAGHDMVDHVSRAQLQGADYVGGTVTLHAGQGAVFTFDPPCGVRHIVIGNGPIPFHTPEARLTIEVRDAGGDWRGVSQSDMTFGDDLYGLPLTIDLGPGHRPGALRLTADKDAQLSFVSAIGPSTTTDRFRFIATRFDGLCQRLSTLLNAAVLAEVTGQDFGFTWIDADLPEIDEQANDDLTQLFTPEFIVRHRVAVDDLNPGMPHYLNSQYSERQFDWLMDAARDHGTFHVDRPGNLPVMFPHLSDRLPPGTDARVFHALGFTETAREAIEIGRQIALPEQPVGLHLRAGDIVHGTHSNHGGYIHKAVSIFEAEGVAAKTMENGRPLILIGQERSFCDAMAARFDHVTSLTHLAEEHGLTPLQSVLLDMTLMTRMVRIWAAQSAVSQLARKLGEGKLAQLRNGVFLPDALVFDADPFGDAAYDGVSNNYKAFSALKLAWTIEPQDWTDEHLAAVRYAIDVRPGIQFPHLVAAGIEARLGRPDKAEEAAAIALALAPEFDDWDVIPSYVLSRDPPAPMGLLAVLNDAAGPGRPALNFLSAAARAFHFDDGQARRHLSDMIDGRGELTLRPALAQSVERLVFGTGSGAERPEDKISWLL